MPEILERLRQALGDRYLPDREIGQGGMARIYLARDLKHDRMVAIKVLRPELVQLLGPERFLREIHIAAQLHHPNILPLFDSGEAQGLLYYVMPYLEGESLRARLQREHQFPLEDALRIAREVADALGYAHSMGIIHRDIKPENILLDQGHAVVADFGVARAVLEAGAERITSVGLVVGTAPYMSPEQGAGQEDLDGRSDLYSLACVLYEMLGGVPPFTGPTSHAIIARHQLDPVPPLSSLRPSLPPKVEAAVGQGLAKMPADRFSTVRGFIAALEGIAPVPQRRRRWRWWPAAALALGAVLALVLWWRGSREPAALGQPSRLDPRHIAVLYFQDLTPDSSLGYLATGLTQDLIDELSRVPALSVISAEGVKPFRYRQVPLDSLARMRQVGTVVTGSVDRDADRIRVSVQLVNPESGVQLDDHTVEAALPALFDLQDSITQEVASVLRRRIGVEVRNRETRQETRSVEAWTRMQQSRDLINDAGELVARDQPEGAIRLLHRADTLLRHAEAADPKWLRPTLGRARTALVLGQVASTEPGDSAIVRQAFDSSRALVAKALRREPGNAEALAARGMLRYTWWERVSPAARDTLAAAARDLQAAVEKDPVDAEAWYILSRAYFSDGHFAEADAAAARAYAADAYLTAAPRILSGLFFTALTEGRFEDAASWCTQGRSRFPQDPNFVDCKLRLLGWSGNGRPDIDSAWAEFRRLAADTEGGEPAVLLERQLMVAAVLARSGRLDSARSLLSQAVKGKARLSRVARLALTPFEAYVTLLAGQRADALALLAALLQEEPADRKFLATSPWFRSLHEDSAFIRLLADTPSVTGAAVP